MIGALTKFLYEPRLLIPGAKQGDKRGIPHPMEQRQPGNLPDAVAWSAAGGCNCRGVMQI
jgi:hypothetical protein